ncbi:FISUMP domain-containing protein [Winogradskyella haliclonae]|uniref:Fibrobacter succinogenes major paralogous domain-containing protein n=1 Tax=Winogradskyella haliclonae TaxID=2048558 RepID=A0ABQ2BZI9_9FLAO|nr:FISUMP domain-containing protein [Winogradskyella haliclonae]GGI57247.1 hypothetical protein GCM10011444_15560 [Winogradskyella haliclonae]
MKNPIRIIAALLVFTFFFNCSNSDDNNTQEQQELTFTDIDGNTYNTITIGNQVWAAENLKTTTFNDGTPITEYTFEVFGSNWGNLNNQTPLFQWADTSDFNNAVDEELPPRYYAAMYNYFALENGNLAPEGWRIPTEADFRELESFLAANGQSGNEATALKSEIGWVESSGNGNGGSIFNALPNGYVSAGGSSIFPGGICTLATSDITNPTGGTSLGSQRRILVQLFDEPEILFDGNAIQIGAGVRLIKD